MAETQEQSRKVKLKPLIALLPYLKARKWAVAGGGLALLASAGTMLAIPLAVRRIIDYGFSGTDQSLINTYFLTLMGMGVLLALASSARVFFVNWLGERVVADLRADVFRHLTTLGPAFFATTHSGEVMSRLTADTTQIKSAAGSAISQALRNTIMLVGALAFMFITSFNLSAMVLLAIPAIVLPLMAYGAIVRKLSRQAQDSLAEASAYAAENLAAVDTLQSFTSERQVSSKFKGAVEDAFRAAVRRLKARAGLTVVAMAMTTVSIVGVLWYGSTLVASGEMTAGRLSQFVLYAVFAAGALAELAEVMGEVQQASGAAERLSELLNVPAPITEVAAPLDLPSPLTDAVRFQAVLFAYPNRPETKALANVDITVPAGGTVALVGPSGAGKTTIMALLQRFYDPDSGVITIDGVDISKARIADLRGQMAIVSQNVAVFADTVAENIRYGRPDATDAQVMDAARAAQADGFIRALDNGYETQLGERGVTLSGGQRQRIAIARAILRDAPILLLDEATSALDAENEGAVQAALETVMKGRTTLVIAHRLATIQRADRIVVLDDGRVIEQGTHADLLAARGLYARLADLQFVGA
ncbi:MAG: ABC transporter transmembrane domain-containing protein [Pseudomonadota bacterium]